MAVLEELDLSDHWLLWTNTPEGVFLTVRADILPAERSIERIKERLLKHRVMNFDAVRIATAIARMSGVPELVGAPFVRFNDEKLRHLFVQVTPYQVRLAVRSSILETDLHIKRADIEFIFMEKDVVHGIDWETIDYLLQSAVYDQETIVATADYPVNGSDADICEMIAIDPDARPIILDDGSVDYRNLENIRKVQAGDVICVRVPSTAGLPGTSVFGKPLAPNPGREIRLPCGQNVHVNEDQTLMSAAHSGYLFRRNGLIHVGNIYVVRGDVCFKSGNVEYNGDVLIKGSVLSGFRVAADGDITIEGSVDGAEIISRSGSVVVRDAVFGKGKAVITAAQNVILAVAQDCEIHAGNEVRVRNYLRGSTVYAKKLDASRKDCEVSSCQVYFEEQIRCAQIGGRSASPTSLIFVENEREKYMAQAQDLEDAVTQLRSAQQNLEKGLKATQVQLKNLNKLNNPELVNRVQLLSSQLQAIKSKFDWADEKRKRTLRFIEILPDRENLIECGVMEPVLKVSIYGHTKEYRSPMADWRIGWKSGAIRMEPV